MKDKSEVFYSKAVWFLKLSFVFLAVAVVVWFLFDSPSWQAWQWHYLPEIFGLFLAGVSASFGARALGLGILWVVAGGIVIVIPAIIIVHSLLFKVTFSVIHAVTYVWLSSPLFVGVAVGWKYGRHTE